MSTHDQYHTNTNPKPAWERAKLDRDSAQDLREQLAEVPYLTQAFNELSAGLDENGASRTVFQLPINLSIRGAESAMYSVARGAAEVIRDEGMNDLGGSFVVRENELPEDFGTAELPAGAKAYIDPTTPIGYMRMEKTETGLQASVGCLDPQTQVHYSQTL